MQTERHIKTLDSVHSTIKSLAESLSTSLGPKGCDKMIVSKELLITNDGATILKNFKYFHPINKVLQSVSEQMDMCCGDGTTSVVLLVGALVNELYFLIQKNVRTTFLVKVLDKIKQDCLDYIDRVKFCMQGTINNLYEHKQDSLILNSGDNFQNPNDSHNSSIENQKISTGDEATKYSDSIPKDEIIPNNSTSTKDEKIKKNSTQDLIKKFNGSNSNSQNISEIKNPSNKNNIEIIKQGSSKYLQAYEKLTVEELFAQCQTSEIENMTFDRELLLQSVYTALNSKVVNQCLAEYAPIAVDACLMTKGDVSKIKITKQNGSMEDICLKKSIILSKNIKNDTLKKGSTVFTKKAKLAILQFCLSPPKPNLDYKVDVKNAEAIMKIPLEEREYLINICQEIKKSGVDLVLIQKSLMRDSLSDLALNFLTKLGILAVDGLERDEIAYICDILKINPSVQLSSIEFGECTIIESVENKIKTTEILSNDACAIIVKGSDSAILDEAERSLHDALCVVRCLLEEPFLVSGGGSIEAGISALLSEKSDLILQSPLSNNFIKKFEKSSSITNSNSKSCNQNEYTRFVSKVNGNLGSNHNDKDSIDPFLDSDETRFYSKSLVYERIAIAFSQIPYYLAYNAGMEATPTVSELLCRIKHESSLGINTRVEDVSCMRAENVIQPAKISKHLVSLAIETAQTIIKIDDILPIKE